MKTNVTFSWSITLCMLLSLCLSTTILADNSTLPEENCDELSPSFLFAGIGDSCAVPIIISEGMHTVDTLVGEGAVGDMATAAKWYSYTPSTSGAVNINSCLGGADTRLWVWTGDCSALVLVTENDDNCDLGDGVARASEVNFNVNAGTEYLINWDDRWSASGFDFTVTLGALLVDITLTVDMSLEMVAPDGAHIAGEFNDWTGEPMTDNGDSTWTFTITGITAGDMIEYKFQNGFEGWEGGIPAECSLGMYGNRFLIAGLENSTEPTVCFNSCEACPPLGTCANPEIIIEDDIEGLALGDATGQVAHWGAWPGASLGGNVIADPTGNSGQVISIDGSNAGQDALLVLNDTTSGHFAVIFELFVPSGNNAYFNLQHEAPTPTSGLWAFHVFFDDGGMGQVQLFDADGTIIDFSFNHDEWFLVAIFADIDSDEARIVIGRTTVAAWTFSDGSDDGTTATPNISSGLNSINFFPLDDTYVYHIDNVGLVELPAAGTNEYCYTATDITPGITSVGELQCFGGMWDIIEGNGFSGAWYRYQPAEDGIISLSSCNEGVDTRAWIFEGGCHDLKIVGVNDDQCDLGDGDEYASYREAIVAGGNTYYIMWDDFWEPSGFDFELTFSTGTPEPGHFCQSAIPVTPGELNLLETFDGDAAVAGPDINGGFGWTPFAKSNWYQYTPPFDTTITITSCVGATDFTWVFVYTGDCSNFDGLELLASNIGGCGDGASIVENLQVTAGTTYYIEWINVRELPFNWIINYFSPGDITFSVNMSEYTDPFTTVYVSGTFNGWSGDANPLTDMGNSIWSGTITMPAGFQEYKFSIDNWAVQELFAGGEPCTITTGTFINRYVEVIGDATLDVVCFNSCTDCVVNTEELAFQNSIEVYPNPAKDLTNIIYDLDQASDLIVRLTNNLGQIVSTDLLVNAQSGNHELELNKLAAGIYYLNVTNGQHSEVTKLVIE